MSHKLSAANVTLLTRWYQRNASDSYETAGKNYAYQYYLTLAEVRNQK